MKLLELWLLWLKEKRKKRIVNKIVLFHNTKHEKEKTKVLQEELKSYGTPFGPKLLFIY